MTTTAVIQRASEGKPQDGTYEGVWSGYNVRFWRDTSNSCVTYEAETMDGIRTQAARCWVVVADGNVVVTTEEPK